MITLALVTARPSPMLEWFFQSLARNNHLDEVGQIIVVDRFSEAHGDWTEANAKDAVIRACEASGKFASITQVVPPKPCVWSGKHRLTPRQWWSASNYRNTALCYATGDFIAYLDDRCVLAPTWMDAVHEAREKQYVVAGTYEKRSGMVVRDGVITHPGTTTATDPRMANEPDPMRRRPCHGDWLFGCTFALPTEWMLQVNGLSELADPASMEDTLFGKILQNNGFPIFHDGRMKMIEDRTPAEQDPTCREHDMKRSSKEKHPHDSSDKIHTLLRTEAKLKRSSHQWDLRKIRQDVLSGGSFPIPSGPAFEFDWFDHQPLREMT